MSEEAFSVLRTAGSEARLAAGEVLWQGGDEGTHAALLLEGALEVVSETENGDVLVLRTLHPGALLGEMSSLEGGVHSATVRAAVASRLRRIPAATLRDLVFGSPELSRAVYRVLAERLRALSRQMTVLAFDGVVARVACHLLERATVGEMLLRATHQELGERIAATRESVTKALGLLARSGALRLRRGEVEICDMEMLRDLAE